jgi:hypothetical protein
MNERYGYFDGNDESTLKHLKLGYNEHIPIALSPHLMSMSGEVMVMCAIWGGVSLINQIYAHSIIETQDIQ